MNAKNRLARAEKAQRLKTGDDKPLIVQFVNKDTGEVVRTRTRPAGALKFDYDQFIKDFLPEEPTEVIPGAVQFDYDKILKDMGTK